MINRYFLFPLNMYEYLFNDIRKRVFGVDSGIFDKSETVKETELEVTGSIFCV